jgi:hypothetical protein
MAKNVKVIHKSPQKCIYFQPKLLGVVQEKVDNEGISFSQYVNRALKFYLDQHKDLFDVDTSNLCIP